MSARNGQQLAVLGVQLSVPEARQWAVVKNAHHRGVLVRVLCAEEIPERGSSAQRLRGNVAFHAFHSAAVTPLRDA